MHAVPLGDRGRSEFVATVPGCALGESESPRPRATLLRPKKLDHASRGCVRAINCSSRAQWKTLTNKSPKTRMDLQALVLARLRAAPQCGGASHVTVVPYDDYRVPASWEVASLDLGTSDWEKCERALWAIMSRLQQCFDVSQ